MFEGSLPPPRKRFGQNFLHDARVIEKIIEAINPHQQQKLLEIGPGRGALTFPMLNKGVDLTALEIDRDLVAYLKAKQPNLHVIEADALQFDYTTFAGGRKIRLFGNLPYNISTPLLISLLPHLPEIEDLHFMLQKEVAARICAPPACKAYGRLSVLLQYYCETEALLEVAPMAFSPPPKVYSSLLRLRPYPKPPYPYVAPHILSQLLKLAFGHRRKILKTNLKPWINEEILQSFNIDLLARAEDLTVGIYAEIGNFLTVHGIMLS